MNAPTVSDRARALAVHLDAKKVGIAQHQDGDWVVRFKVTADSMPTALTQAPMGQRFVVALVAIGDNEEPVTLAPAKPVADKPITPRKPVAPDKRLAQQAGIACAEPAFWRFLDEVMMRKHINDADDAAMHVRILCGNVDSRRDIVPGTPAGDAWEGIYGQYLCWKML